ncbi:CRAL-TRIO domain-containing protein C3H8.02 [Agrilus planipennis]|uniref:CRAL-TRIO domain-containing protein C3H8.02 n=1 Tax=Agrilus planipennis TaxID=224129 RepID=A0A1W4XUN5_AGRPL|nr:CRAL-TRIO domain-containing protein C3H8.02 [Agrilus planipennis]
MSVIKEEDVQELKSRMKLISEADPSQYHNEFSIRRYLKAFKTTDAAFQGILKTNKWRKEYGVDQLTNETPTVVSNMKANKARVLRHRDLQGRPIIYIPVKYHSSTDRDIDELTKFIVFCLEEASKKCFEEVIDNFCIIFDLKDFNLGCMDYQVLKNLIWLFSRHYPERLGVCLILNSSAVFSGCWAIIKGWLDENTANKVKFIGSEMELCSYLIPDVLPVDI